MTAVPQPQRPQQELQLPLTVADFAALGEDEQRYWELQEGSLVMTPRPALRHMRVVKELLIQLDPQLPDGAALLPEVDIDLQLAPSDQPGSVRVPDLVIADQDAVDRVESEGGLLRAADVRLAVEIVSAGSRRMDNVVKRGEYADAGIGHYWIVDLDPPVSLLACHQAGELGYADDGERTGTFSTTEPYSLTINLDKLA